MPAGGDAFVFALDLAGRARWARRMAADRLIQGEMDVLPGGDVLLCGAAAGMLTMPPLRAAGESRWNGFVARIGADGEPQFLETWTGTGNVVLRDLARVGAEAWVVGSFDGQLTVGGESFTARGLLDVLVLRIDPESGATRGAFTFGTEAEDLGRGIAPLLDGVVLTGSYGSPWGPEGDPGLGRSQRTLRLPGIGALEPVGDADGFVIHLGRDESYRWAKRLAGPGFDVVKQAVVVGSSVVVSVASQPQAPPPGVSGMASDVPMGGYVASLDPSGTELWRWFDPAIVSPHDLVALDGGRIAAVGHYRDGLAAGAQPWRSQGETDVMLVILDGEGRPVGGDHCGGPGGDFGYIVAATPSGTVLFGGNASPGSTCTQGRGGGPMGFVRAWTPG